jgi:hypothetical protein
VKRAVIGREEQRGPAGRFERADGLEVQLVPAHVARPSNCTDEELLGYAQTRGLLGGEEEEVVRTGSYAAHDACELAESRSAGLLFKRGS